VTNGQRSYAPKPLPPPPAGPRNRFGFFGQMVDAKGVHILLRAVSALRAQGFTDFVVEFNGENLRYASAPIREEIEAFLAAEAARPADEQIVVHNGGYHVDDLAQRMARIDWCVVPSTWWEIFGLVISEAWMFGKPVIGANVGGPAERIRHDVDGLHFAIGDPRALAAAIRRAATEKGLWQRLRANLPAPPSREAMVRGFLDVYGVPDETMRAAPRKPRTAVPPARKPARLQRAARP
jgi:glycosyltransferase involved in cell wall biosynthesis